MKSQTSKIIIHMVSSLDGFIASKDGSIDWMQSTDQYDQGETLTESKIEEFLASIDCYVMGARTYEQALVHGWPYGAKPVWVVTHKKLKKYNEHVSFFSGHLGTLVTNELKPRYNNIWMVGGAQLTKKFLQLNLADEIVISIMPILLGDGTLFFDYIGKEQRLHLKDVTSYKDGMVEMSYEIIKR